MANINWITTIPSATSVVGLGASDIRGHKYALSSGLGESCNFLDTDSPVQQGAASVATSTDESGIFDASDVTCWWQFAQVPVIASDTSRMFSYVSVADSTISFMIGTRGYSEYGTALDDGETCVEISGFTKVATPGRYEQSFGTTFASTPTVFVSTQYANQSLNGVACNVRLWWTNSVVPPVNTESFWYAVEGHPGINPQSATSVYWTAIGPIAKGI